MNMKGNNGNGGNRNTKLEAKQEINTKISGEWKMEEKMKEIKLMVMDESEHTTWSVDSPR